MNVASTKNIHFIVPFYGVLGKWEYLFRQLLYELSWFLAPNCKKLRKGFRADVAFRCLRIIKPHFRIFVPVGSFRYINIYEIARVLNPIPKIEDTIFFANQFLSINEGSNFGNYTEFFEHFPSQTLLYGFPEFERTPRETKKPPFRVFRKKYLSIFYDDAPGFYLSERSVVAHGRSE